MPISLPPGRDPAREADHPLARAFRSFTDAAGSLERTYGQLHGQVAQLRRELEVTNRNLTVSLRENLSMRERLRRICGACLNRFFPKWWSFHRSKFRP
jgi:nitrate/nitrite-specific signal transduction histidine kinase